MTSVVEVLNGQAPAGIYQAEHLDVEPIAHQALQRGWHCQVIDGSLIVDRHEALAAFGQVLDFPDHYGKNLDALADCLAELPRKTLVLWTGAHQALADLIPVLEDRALAEPAFAVFVAL
ncbi:MAG TPA: barstar family protein [Marmoricola sp.]|jgi:hypothetical protein|nr:barstar family protein [Nocardioidaceae bacterium]MCB8993620.1 barstar family protein [Nocardioidaceae bacterium]HRV69455.1 barstar family protein [Marmoricola sp.]